MNRTASRLVMCLICVCVIVPLVGCSSTADHVGLPTAICGRSPAELQGLVDAIAQEELSDAQWDEVVGAVGSMDEELYAAAIYSTLPPEAVATLAWRLSATYSWPLKAPASYFSRIGALGVLLGVATRSICAPLQADYASDVVSVLKRNPSPLPAAMSMILAHGQYDPPFALTIATQISQYETTPGFSWQNVAEEPNQIHMIADDGSWRTDAMAGILAMLATAPDAAQEFFTTGDTTPLDGYGFDVNSRLDHLIREHSWTSYSDEGAGLGAVLESAATTYRTLDSRGQTSASLATQIFALVGDRTNNHWQMPTGMRPNMATIVASYMPDLLTASDYPATIADFSSGGVLYQTKNNDYFPGFPAGAKFTHKDMMAILQTVCEDVDNVAILGQGWAVAATAYLGFNLSTNYSDPEKKSTLVAHSGHTSDGLFMDSLIPGRAVFGDIVNASLSSQPAGDALYHSRLATGILQSACALPMADLGKNIRNGTMADWVYVDALSFTAAWQGEEIESGDNALDHYNTDLYRASTRWFLQILYGLGFWDQDVIDTLNDDPTGSNPYTIPPDDIFTDSTRSVFNWKSDGYLRWYEWDSEVAAFLSQAALIFKVN